MARSSRATVQVVEQVEASLARGATVAQAAAAVGVSARTLKRWIATGVVVRRQLRSVPDPEPGDAAEGRGKFTDDQVEAAMVSAILKAAAVDWRAARFILVSRWPERWGAR